MKLVFLLPGAEGRPKILNGDTIRYGGAPASGTDQSVIAVAEYLVKQGHDVTVVIHKTDKQPCRGVNYTDFTYEGLENKEIDIIVSTLWFSEYNKLPFKVTKALLYWFHMAWVYGIEEMTQFCTQENIKLGFINVSEWARGQNKWSIDIGKDKLSNVLDVVIPNPIMIELVEEIQKEKNIIRKEKSTIFHAQYGRGGDVANRAVKELGWKEMYRFDYTDPSNGTDKKIIFEKLLESDYFIFPLYHPNGCVYKDTFSCAVAEAIAAGVIVVTYPLGAIPEYFSEGCSFLIFPHGTDMDKMMTEKVTCDAQYMDYHGNIVENLKYLESNPEIKNSIREKSKDLIKNNFSIEIIGKKWDDLLKNFEVVENEIKVFDGENPFNFFDKIFYINLDERIDRREIIERQLTKYGIQAERFSAISLTKEENDELVKRGCKFYDDTRPEYAPKIKSCTLSHLTVLLRAKLMQYGNILVLEDDVTFDENILKELDLAIKDLKKEPNWDMFYLGCNPLHVKRVTENLGKSLGALTTHAYAVNGHFYDRLLEIHFRNLPCIDVWYASLAESNNVYLTVKNLAWQSAGFSTIEGHETDYKPSIENKYKTLFKNEDNV